MPGSDVTARVPDARAEGPQGARPGAPPPALLAMVALAALVSLCLVPFASRHTLLADALPQHKDYKLVDLLASHDDSHDPHAIRPPIEEALLHPAMTTTATTAPPRPSVPEVNFDAETVETTAPARNHVFRQQTPVIPTHVKATSGSNAATAAAAAAADMFAELARERAARGELAPPPPPGEPVERRPDVVSAQISSAAFNVLLHAGNPKKASALQAETASLGKLDQELLQSVMDLGPQQRVRLAIHDQMRKAHWRRSEDGRFLGAVAMNRMTVPAAGKPLITPWMDRRSMRTNTPKLRDLGKVPENLRALLPAHDPFAPIAYNRCAVVGSGGNLLSQAFGEEIDGHDAVFRFNVAPTFGFERFVGNKTTVRMVNRMHFAFRETEEEIVLQHVTTDDVMKYFNSLLRKNPGVRTYALDMGFYDSMIEWYRVQQPTNGFFGLKLALLLCDSVTVYGFVRSWRGHFPYHYFNDEIPNDTQFRRDSGGELPLIQRLVHHYGESRLRFRHPCVLNRKCPWDVCAYGSQCEKGGTPYPVPQKGYCVRHVGIMPGTPEEGQPVVPPLPNGKPTLYAAQAEHLRGLPSAVRSSPSSPMLGLVAGATECFHRCLDEEQCPGGSGPKGLCREDIPIDAAGDGASPEGKRFCGGGGAPMDNDQMPPEEDLEEEPAVVPLSLADAQDRK